MLSSLGHHNLGVTFIKYVFPGRLKLFYTYDMYSVIKDRDSVKVDTR